MAFLTTPKHGGWLILAAALTIAGLVASSLVPHRHRCHTCGRLFTTPDFDQHLASGHRVSGRHHE